MLYKCLTCIRYSGKPSSQLVGDLPKARVTPGFPFQRSGVDYAGPFNVRLSKTRDKETKKGYIAIFVCMARRAVRLEIVEDYRSDAFINAFHRFTARRGYSSELFSDKGTNFIGTDKQLREMFSEASFHYEQVFYALSRGSTSWIFNPPSAPHFGGLWEALGKVRQGSSVGDTVASRRVFTTFVTCVNKLIDDESYLYYSLSSIIYIGMLRLLAK